MPRNRLLRWGVLPAIGTVIVVVVVAGIVYELRRPRDVSHPQVSFTAPVTTAQPPPAPRPSTFSWPLYGYTLARTRDFSSAPGYLAPPFRVGWRHGHNALLEFSPSIYGDSLYYMDDSATVRSLDISSGRRRWARRVGTLSAATPALDPAQGLLFVPTLSDTGHTPGDGRLVALSMTNGHIRWSLPLAPGSESSPLYSDGTVYFGDQGGTVYALDAADGHLKWRFHAAGAVKGGPALSGGLLYFGDYAGKVYALHASTGRPAWTAGTGSGAFGFGSGTFYSTPAVEFGRVFIGNTNGFVYSFAARTGQLAWSRGTGAYVYSGPAVADPPQLGPTIYIGSYNGDLYALDARSGAVRWIHHDGYPISGAATVVGDVVYYSDFDHRTTGLNVVTGKVQFSFHDGAYTPIVATPTALYLDGKYTLYELLPRDAPATGKQGDG